ncbi:hypothetical protein KFE25_008803 [Diacronema lutheri]|nr:hypothetical protein KFE25_008803 [Diacronema lutheri]
MRSVYLVIVAQLAVLCGAFRAPTALRRASSPSLLVRTRAAMSEPQTSLKFEELPEDIEDAPALSQAEAMEIAMGRADLDDGPAAAEVQVKPALLLRPESELSETELRDRKRMEAVKKYAPWMADAVSPEAIAQREAAERERKENKREKLVGNRIDPAKQELSGTGLKLRVSSAEAGGDVQLEWSTGGEDSNLGFIVSRKSAADPDFVDIASYDTFQSLRSKGAAGGQYTFVDENVAPGSYLYKVMDVAVGSKFMTEVCRRGIEVETTSEQTSTVALVAGFAAVAGVLFAITNVLDPQ